MKHISFEYNFPCINFFYAQVRLWGELLGNLLCVFGKNYFFEVPWP